MSEPETIEDRLRAMLRQHVNRQRALKAAATRQRNALAKYQAESRARSAQGRHYAKVKARREEHQRQLREAFPEAFANEMPRTGKRGRPRVKVYAEEIARFHKTGVAGQFTTRDRHGRLWLVVKDRRGWTAYGPQDVLDGKRRRAIIRKGSAGEIRDAMRKAVVDIERYMNLGSVADWKHFDD